MLGCVLRRSRTGGGLPAPGLELAQGGAAAEVSGRPWPVQVYPHKCLACGQPVIMAVVYTVLHTLCHEELQMVCFVLQAGPDGGGGDQAAAEAAADVEAAAQLLAMLWM